MVTARPWAGIDLMDMGNDFLMVKGEDMARKAWNLRRKICNYQETFSVLEKVRRTDGWMDRAEKVGGTVSQPLTDIRFSCSARSR